MKKRPWLSPRASRAHPTASLSTQALLAERYVRVFKDAAEEVTELFGYTLLMFAMVELVLWIRRRQARSQ